MTEASTVRAEIAEHLDEGSMREVYEKHTGLEKQSDYRWQLFQAGEWLDWKMGEASAKEKEDLCFAFGQKCWPNRDPFTVAADVFDRWRAGNPDEPGAKLGEEIFQEVFQEIVQEIDRDKG